jgi:hypothetical protein
MDNREDYGYGWNEKGQRFHALKSGRRQGGVNMIAALCQGQLIAPFTVEGACNRAVFEIWLETCLIPNPPCIPLFRLQPPISPRLPVSPSPRLPVF